MKEMLGDAWQDMKVGLGGAGTGRGRASRGAAHHLSESTIRRGYLRRDGKGGGERPHEAGREEASRVSPPYTQPTGP